MREHDGRRFALTELGEPLRSDAPGSLATGENAFRHVFGTDVWSWRAQRPEESAIFDRAMATITSRINEALLRAHNFARYGSVVDVGGGSEFSATPTRTATASSPT